MKSSMLKNWSLRINLIPFRDLKERNKINHIRIFAQNFYLISGVPLRNCVTDKSAPLTVMLSMVLYSWHLEAIKIAILIVR